MRAFGATLEVMKFATKLVLLGGSFLAAGAALAFFFGRVAVGTLETQLVDRMQERAFHAVGNLDRYYYERYRETRELAADPVLGSRTADPLSIAGVLQEFLRWHPEYESASMLSLDGVRIADSAGSGVGERDATAGFRADFASGGEFASDTRPASAGEAPLIHFAVAVKDGQGAPRGVVVTRMSLGVFDRVLGGLAGTEAPVSVDLVDRQGRILYSSYNPGGVLREHSPDWDQVQERLREGRDHGHLRYTNPRETIGEEILFFARERGFRDYPGSGWTLNVFTPARTALAPAVELRNRMVAGVLIAGGALLLAMQLLVRAFTRPIADLSAAAAQAGEGSLDARVAVRSRDELGRFGEAFNRMVAELAASHRKLAAHASELEGRVQERTAELLQANELLHAELYERVKAEESLRLSQKRYRDLFDASADGVYAVNADGVFTSMNQAGAAIFGYRSPEDIIGRPALEYWRDPRDREVFRAVLKSKKTVSAYRMKARKCNGEQLELETSSRILEDENGGFLGIEGVLRDVTERVRAEAERELLIAQLQEAAASIKTLTGLLPICAGCKKIRDDRGSWSQIEVYVSSHTMAQFSHGLCPDCMKVYFPGTKLPGAGSDGGV